MKYLTILAMTLVSTTTFAAEVCVIERTGIAIENYTAYARTRESSVIRCTDGQLLESLAASKLLVKYSWGYHYSDATYTNFGIPGGNGLMNLQKALLENQYTQTGCGGEYIKP